MRGRVWLAAAALLGIPTQAAEYAVEVGGAAAEHRGFLQTPAGGRFGTASPERPTLGELGLGRGGYGWLAASIGFGRYALAVRYTGIGDDAVAVLGEPLLAQGRLLSADTALPTKVSFDGLAIALGRSFALGDKATLVLGPWLGWTAFSLEINADQGNVDRSYRVYALGVKAEADRPLGERWGLRCALTLAPAFEGSAKHHSAECGLRYGLGARATLRLGARFERFGYDDAHKQELPNRLDVRRAVRPALAFRWRW